MPAALRFVPRTYPTTYSTLAPGWTPMDMRLLAQDRRHQLKTQGIGAPPVGAIGQVVSSLANSAVRRVRIESQITPDYEYVPSSSGAAASDQGGIVAWVMREIVRPGVVIETPVGAQEYYPYGRPRVKAFWVLAGLAVAGGIGLGALAVRGLRRKNPPRRRGRRARARGRRR